MSLICKSESMPHQITSLEDFPKLQSLTEYRIGILTP